MDYQIKESRVSQLSARLNLMVLLVLGLMLSNIILAYHGFYAAKHQTREVVPYGCSNGYIISESNVDTFYLNLMTENFIYSRLNVTPLSVAQNHTKLLNFVDSSIYPLFKKKLAKEEAIIKSKKIASYFDILDVRSDSQHLISEVRGQLKRYVGYRALKVVEKNYRIQYRYQLGKLTIVGFKEEKGEHDA